MAALDRPEQSLSPLDRPAEITQFELVELLDMIEELMSYSRAGSLDADAEETAAWFRAKSLLDRLRHHRA